MSLSAAVVLTVLQAEIDGIILTHCNFDTYLHLFLSKCSSSNNSLSSRQQ